MIFDKFLKKEIPERNDKIMHWKSLYEGETKPGITSLMLPSAISSELARLTTIEMNVKVSGHDLLKKAIADLTPRIRSHVESVCALGGGMFRPYYDGEIFRVEFFPADRFEITSFGCLGRPEGCIFKDQFFDGSSYYTRLEEHKMTKDGYIITNRAYRSKTKSYIGSEIPLNSVDRWEKLSKEVLIHNVHRPLFVYFKMPQNGLNGAYEKLGESVFARAEHLIAEADKQFSRLLWEFEGGELAIDASIDALRFNERGIAEAPKLSKRLFRGLGIDAGERDLYSVFSPSLRDESIINGLNEILMRIEDVCGLARGTFSNVEGVAKTATEIKILNQRSYATVCDIQRELETALNSIADTVCDLAELYGLKPHSTHKIAIEFDDSIVTDRQTEFNEKLLMFDKGIIDKDEFRKWYFGG